MLKWFSDKSKDSERGQPKSFKPREISFLGKQDGAVEKELKGRLTRYFTHSVRVRKAYLARVCYEGAPDVKVALCLADDGADRQAIVNDVGTEFHQMFKTTESLDIIFLSPEQERKLAAVAEPFYQQPAHRA